jgi:hypothetical protein
MSPSLSVSQCVGEIAVLSEVSLIQILGHTNPRCPANGFTLWEIFHNRLQLGDLFNNDHQTCNIPRRPGNREYQPGHGQSITGPFSLFSHFDFREDSSTKE